MPLYFDRLPQNINLAGIGFTKIPGGNFPMWDPARPGTTPRETTVGDYYLSGLATRADVARYVDRYSFREVSRVNCDTVRRARQEYGVCVEDRSSGWPYVIGRFKYAADGASSLAIIPSDHITDLVWTRPPGIDAPRHNGPIDTGVRFLRRVVPCWMFYSDILEDKTGAMAAQAVIDNQLAYHQAIGMADFLTHQANELRENTDEGYQWEIRLPSEAEWHYAANGDFDMQMTADVWQWCMDYYRAGYEPSQTDNPTGPYHTHLEERVLRGGLVLAGRQVESPLTFRGHKTPVDYERASNLLVGARFVAKIHKTVGQGAAGGLVSG
ncbi:MAG: hypothetical protein HQM16_11350 [Deltaproteobacteria bacterium]|nr:hypothetical protein [Deltaproteobacteria bacterium]